jgi:glycyl-tRNA synthetase beta chain
MSTKNLLVELFVEELPPKALKKLGEAFAATLCDTLKAQGLAAADSAVTPYASPRRLAVRVTRVAAQAADKPVSHKLMPVTVALTADGQATPALQKKLAALGLDASVLPQLKRAADGKAEALFFDTVVPGATLAAGLQKALDEALARLPIPKVMTYQLQDGWSSVNFVRPAHALVALHGDEVVPVSALGLNAGRETQGHRFEAASHPVSIRNADSYAAQMAEEGAVIASFADRRADIARQLTAAAAKVGGGVKPIEDDALLDEVTALVERPNVLPCHFEPEFLEVPQECLILTMKANQKYFPLLDAAGRLTNQFLIVSNISPADPSAVIGGNERVVRPRLADAKFFFDQDRKKPLASRVEALDKVVYHNKLGSQGARIRRLMKLAGAIADKLGSRRGSGRARRPVGQGRPGHRHGGRVPRAAGHHGPLLRPPRRRGPARGASHRRPLQAPLRRRRPGRPTTSACPWPWPSAWTAWWASSASAPSPPATRTPSPCAGPPWACCACSWKRPCPWT